MAHARFDADTLIDDVMRQCPNTITTLVSENMQCIGCPLAHMHTVEFAAHEHGKDCKKLLARLNKVAASTIN
jgi:hybrid cluster-associated redox disulfide protein